jgi:Bacterial RNA polymerase, alpha chain C terminal domain
VTRPPRAAWAGRTAGLPDPFAVNPIRRACGLVGGSALVVFAPLLAGEEVATMAMLSVGWLGVTGLVMGVPILLLCLAEEGWRRARRRLQPTVEQLGLSPRVVHVLRRHGYDSIAAVDRAPDAALLLLSNMDARALREVRRALSLWHYRRWQDGGFR